MTRYFSVHSFVAGTMLGALLAGAYFIGNGSVSFPALYSSTPSFATTSSRLATETSGTVSVADQPSGMVVMIGSVTVPPPGVWVAVREVSIGNDLGNVLGAVRVTGPRSDLSVFLLRATEPNRPYAVQLYRDDGNGAFDPALNSVYVDFDTGAPVIAYFTTTS